jgi:TPR repeat protein
MKKSAGRVLLTIALLLAPSTVLASGTETAESACRAGQALACRHAAIRATGKAALQWAQRGGSLSDAESCAIVASRLIEAKQDPKALEFARRSCDGGSSEGCYLEGLLQATRRRVLAPAQAFAALRRACLRSHRGACSLVGEMHAEGIGTPKDSTRAAIAFLGSCEGLVARDCRALGTLLAEPADAAAAFQLGCGLKDAESCRLRDQLMAKGITPSSELPKLIDPLLESEQSTKRLLALAPKRRDAPEKAARLEAVPDCRNVVLDPS